MGGFCGCGEQNWYSKCHSVHELWLMMWTMSHMMTSFRYQREHFEIYRESTMKHPERALTDRMIS
jgi:hypothetical protein